MVFLRSFTLTPGKINMEPENGPVEDDSPLEPSGFQVSCYISSV